MHPFDADGMIGAVTIDGGKAVFRNKMVQTEGYKKEQEAGRQLYRGFANIPGGWTKNVFNIARKNLANTNVQLWGGKLMALWEGGFPTILDPKTLETIGESDLGGALKKGTVFSAHPRVDAKRERYVSFGNDAGKVTTYEFDKDMKLLKSRTASLGGITLLHDFVITDKYYVFLVSPVKFKILKYIFGAPVTSILDYDEAAGSKILLMPRDMDEPVIECTGPARGCFHLANGYDDPETGDVIFDAVTTDTFSAGRPTERPIWEEVNFAEEVPFSTINRYQVTPQTKRVRIKPLSSKYCDFPSVNKQVVGQPYSYIFAAAGKSDEHPLPQQGVLKLNVQTGEEKTWFPKEKTQFPGEVVFANKQGGTGAEDDGYLIGFVHDGAPGATGQVVVLDAKTMESVCKMSCRTHIPHGLHGSFWPGVLNIE
ncbi:unnamed protein product [Chrysoparadoxa australica]